MCNLTSHGAGGAFYVVQISPRAGFHSGFSGTPTPGTGARGLHSAGIPRTGTPSMRKRQGFGVTAKELRGVTLRKHFHTSQQFSSGRKTAKGALCHGLHITAKVCESSLTVTLPGHTVRLRKPKPKATTVLSSDLQLHTPHTHARRGRTVHTVESRKRVLAHKLKFPASLISKFKFEGRFEEISASPS